MSSTLDFSCYCCPYISSDFISNVTKSDVLNVLLHYESLIISVSITNEFVSSSQRNFQAQVFLYFRQIFYSFYGCYYTIYCFYWLYSYFEGTKMASSILSYNILLILNNFLRSSLLCYSSSILNFDYLLESKAPYLYILTIPS